VRAGGDDGAVEGFTARPISGVEPDVIFRILVTVCTLSPGLMRTGL
jgi:hypothetical protein